MPLENATNIGELNPLWPLGTDPKGQGDDHIRMIKRTLVGLATELAVSSGVASSAAAYGAIGDGVLHTLQEWVDSGKYASLADIQIAYPKATSLTQSIDAVAIQRCQDTNPNGGVLLESGKVYVIDQTLYLNYVQCEWPLGSWRPAPPSTVDSAIYSSRKGATLLLIGTGPRVHKVDFVTASRQCGFHRANPVRAFNNEFDAEFSLLDLTNKDAVFTNRATLREFSVGVIFGSGKMNDLHTYGMKNVRVVTSCPGIGEVHGTGGYGNYSSIVPWADWDFGVWFRSPWHCELEAAQVVGYYALRGALLTTMAVTESGDTSPDLGYSEFFRMNKSLIQGGFAIRSGDIWPIMSKTTDTVSVPWTASHRFPQAGTLVTSNAGNITYTGLAFDAPNQRLVFLGCSSTALVVDNNTSSTRTVVRTTANGGIANSLIQDSELTDFSHHTRTAEQSSAFGVKQMPIRSCLEISGHPTRAPTLDNNSVYGIGPVVFHLGNARDIEGYSNYCEPKAYTLTPGGALQTSGACLVVGAQAAFADRIPSYDLVDMVFYGLTFIGVVNMMPYYECTSGRYANQTDMCNAAGFFYSDKNLLSGKSTLKLQGGNGKTVLIKSRTVEGGDIDGFSLDGDGNIVIGNGYSSRGGTELKDKTILFSGERAVHHNGEAGADLKRYEWSYASVLGNAYFRTMYDNGTTGRNIISIFRTGVDIDKIQIEAKEIRLEASAGWVDIDASSGNGVRLKVEAGSALTATETEVVSYGSSVAFRSNTDNLTPFGRADKRGSTIYLGSAPIVTSDENEKEDIRNLSDAELAVAKKLRPRMFKYKDRSRTHSGFIAQEVKSAFESEGLDPFQYGILCWDSWEADENQDAGSRYSLRYEELLSFIVGALLCQ